MKKTVCLFTALMVMVFATACGQLETRMAIREGNDAYEQQNYKVAIEKYQEARKIAPNSFPELDRMIGYSYIGLYNPEDKSAQNQKFADSAILELQKYLQRVPENESAREAMVNLMLNADRTSQAIAYFKEYLKTHPADLATVRTIANLYAQKLGDFDESLNWYHKITLLDPNNAEAFYTFGVVVWEKVHRDPPADPQAALQLIERGKDALERAIQLREDYFDALVYLNLLLREQVKLTPDPEEQQVLLARADQYRNRAVAITKAKKAAEAKGGEKP
ncbi:MAG: hypothetical protein ACRD2J_17325 [Thermoanaerobaculia bacterium]